MNFRTRRAVVRVVNHEFNAAFAPIRRQAKTRSQKRMVNRIFRDAYVATFKAIK